MSYVRTLSALFLTLGVVGTHPTASAQVARPHPDEPAILAVIDRFMHAVSTNDAALMSELRLEGGFTIVERPADAGGTTLTRRVVTAGAPRSGAVRERYWDPVVLVRGKIAVVWTPYEFWSGGKTSHCGIDVFDLVNEQGTWKIANTMWTVEPDACPALRPADASRLRPVP